MVFGVRLEGGVGGDDVCGDAVDNGEDAPFLAFTLNSAIFTDLLSPLSSPD